MKGSHWIGCGAVWLPCWVWISHIATRLHDIYITTMLAKPSLVYSKCGEDKPARRMLSCFSYWVTMLKLVAGDVNLPSLVQAVACATPVGRIGVDLQSSTTGRGRFSNSVKQLAQAQEFMITWPEYMEACEGFNRICHHPTFAYQQLRAVPYSSSVVISLRIYHTLCITINLPTKHLWSTQLYSQTPQKITSLVSNILNLSKMKSYMYLLVLFFSFSISAELLKGRDGGRSGTSAVLTEITAHRNQSLSPFQGSVSFSFLKRQQECLIASDHPCGSEFCCPQADKCVGSSFQ